MQDKVSHICDEFFAAAKLDYVGFWEIVSATIGQFSDTSDERRKEVVTEVVKCLLGRGLKAFRFLQETDGHGEHKKEIWDFANPSIELEKVMTIWDALGHEPRLGEVCWFMKG